MDISENGKLKFYTLNFIRNGKVSDQPRPVSHPSAFTFSASNNLPKSYNDSQTPVPGIDKVSIFRSHPS